MRRKTTIVLTITLLVAALVSVSSYIYISELLRQRVQAAEETASNLTSQLVFLATNAAPDLASTKTDTNDPEAVRRAISYYLSTDRDLNNMMESIVGNWPMIYDAAITDNEGKAILHNNADLIGKPVPARPNFSIIKEAKFRQQLSLVYNPPTTYDVEMPLHLNGAPFGTVRVGISTVFLKNAISPHLQKSIFYSGLAVLLSLIFAAVVSHIALGPLERIKRTLDSVTSGEADVVPEEETETDEYGLVTLKIAHLGRQVRDAKEIFSALKDNVDQIMANLQDGLMLFTRDFRVVLVSASVERFLGRSRKDLLGRTAKDIFSPDLPMGLTLLDAFRSGSPVSQRELESPNGKRIQVSLDFIQERGTSIGALVTLRDAESVRRIEDEIETSRRMSASGRLTRGVAHEVKNPINAIVLHLQLLQSKLQEADPATRRHVDIIDSEIHRLDRVIQVLVDFTRPRDLHMEETDLRGLLDDVVSLATPDAGQHGVIIIRELPPDALPVKVDLDFMKQAILNIVLNGIQSMPSGGILYVSAYKRDENAVTEISDHGSGIPPEVQEKIFELYFTTKKGGSGIGLAQAYQVLQWHYGSIDFESVVGRGTTFRLKLPLAESKSESPTEAMTQA